MSSHRKNDFILTVVKNKNEQKILNGCTYLDFDSEYSIRLQNQGNSRALFQIYIDGKELPNKFIIDGNSTVDVERFLEQDLNSGPRFKFVRATHEKVDNPNSSSNGLIEVKIWKEKALDIGIFIEAAKKADDFPYIPHKPYWPFKPYYPWYTQDHKPYKVTWQYQTFFPENTWTAECKYNTEVNCNYRNVENTGATVEGSKSNQKFINSNIGEIETNCITLSIQLKPTCQTADSVYLINKYCSNCGVKIIKTNESINKYCSNCGTKLK